MQTIPTQTAQDDETSSLLGISTFDTHGLCSNYLLRRHKSASEADAGCEELRKDWREYVGPLNTEGSCNTLDGNFWALVLPLCKKERMRLIGYLGEYAFLYDDMVKLPTSPQSKSKTQPSEWTTHDPTLGKTHIQAKMMAQLTATDPICTQRIKQAWQTFLSTTVRNGDKSFTSWEEYVDFRVVDCAAPWVESLMLFGMGMTLSPTEDTLLTPLRYPCYAALGIANDYFSFDREYALYIQPGKRQTLSNAVWLHMHWHNVSVDVAKDMTLAVTRKYEEQFLRDCEELRKKGVVGEKVEKYLRGLAYQVSGNVVWSLRCPRYKGSFVCSGDAGEQMERSLS